jgi:hypothetical protein
VDRFSSTNIQCKMFNFVLWRLEKAARGEHQLTHSPLQFSKMLNETMELLSSTNQSRYEKSSFRQLRFHNHC